MAGRGLVGRGVGMGLGVGVGRMGMGLGLGRGIEGFLTTFCWFCCSSTLLEIIVLGCCRGRRKAAGLGLNYYYRVLAGGLILRSHRW